MAWSTETRPGRLDVTKLEMSKQQPGPCEVSSTSASRCFLHIAERWSSRIPLPRPACARTAMTRLP